MNDTTLAIILGILIALAIVTTLIAIWHKRKAHNLEKDLEEADIDYVRLSKNKDMLSKEIIYLSEKLENAFFRCSKCGKFLKKETVFFGEFQKPYCKDHR